MCYINNFIKIDFFYLRKNGRNYFQEKKKLFLLGSLYFLDKILKKKLGPRQKIHE